jgi:protein-tyrosine phosphatase
VTTTARILTVCTGNICRSPFLERALQQELDMSWGPGAVAVFSGGTGALAGHPMEDQAQALLSAHGYSADGFRAQQLTADLIAQADLVLTATRAHRGKVAALHPRALRYVFAFREFADLVSVLSDDQLGLPGESAGEHVTRVVGLAVGQRGSRPPLSDEDADIVDPYRRPPAVFEQMDRQIMAAMPDVLRALRRT